MIPHTIYGINNIYSTNKFLDEKSYNNNILENMIKSSNIHKKVRIDLYQKIKPKMKLFDIAYTIEESIKKYSCDQLNNGIGFPVGLSINNCAAHDTVHTDTTTILQADDLLKIDFGVHHNGYITDSAFTISFSDKYQDFQRASLDSTNFGINNLKLDMFIGDWSELVQEYVSSKEVNINNKIYPLKTIKDLTGHNILPYQIHGGKFLPSFRFASYNQKITPGIWAVEIFVTNGSGQVYYDNDNITHYSLKNITNNPQLKINKVNKFYQYIKKTFKTLPFCDKWLANHPGYQTSLKILNKNNLIESYPPIYDTDKSSFVSQFEHTIYLDENHKINLSKGLDY